VPNRFVSTIVKHPVYIYEIWKIWCIFKVLGI